MASSSGKKRKTDVAERASWVHAFFPGLIACLSDMLLFIEAHVLNKLSFIAFSFFKVCCDMEPKWSVLRTIDMRGHIPRNNTRILVLYYAFSFKT
jgi:hypothetical protein